MQLFAIAFKNIFRNKRRSILNIIALSTGFVVLLLGLGWVEGYHSYVYQALIRLDTGHAHYVARGYEAEKRRLPVDILIEDYPSARAALLAHPAVAEAGGRIEFALRAAGPGNSSRSVWLGARAVDPAAEASVTGIAAYIEEGKYLDGSGGVLIGRPVARALGLAAGDSLRLSATDIGGGQRQLESTVQGIFNLGYPAMDKSLVFLDLASAARLLGTGDGVNRIVVRLKPGQSTRRFLANPPAVLDRSGTDAGQWFEWKHFARAAVQAVEADSGGFYALIVIIYILTALGILNSLSMTVHERRREIGTLKALGWRASRVRALFLSESLCLCVLATLAGLLVSLPLVWWLQGVGIDLAGSLPADLPIPFGERFYADFRPWHFAFSCALSLLVGLLAAWLPAGRGARLAVAEALRGCVS